MSLDLRSVEVDIAPMIEQALLDPLATPEQVAATCAEAARYHFATVCLYPCHVRQARELLGPKDPKICTVIGFPTGASTATTKRFEACEAVENGADELDVVPNLAWLRCGEYDAFHRELAEICEACDRPVKVILETARLTPEELRRGVEISLDAGVSALKTSTGFFGGATVAAVEQLAQLSRGRVDIKASGGIRSYAQAVELVLAGATRLGTSRGPELLAERDRLTSDRRSQG